MKRFTVSWLIFFLVASLAAAEDSSRKITGDINGPDKVPTGQLAMFTISGVTLEDLTAKPPKITLLCLPTPDGVFYGVFDFLNQRPAALLQSNKPGVFSIVLIDYEKRETQVKEVRVEGGPDPPDPPEPPEPPGPEPGVWAKWIKQTAEQLIKNPNRGKEARAMSAAMKAVLSANAAGVFKDSAQLRGAIKTENVKALIKLYGSQSEGRARALEWEVKLNRALEDKIRKQIPDLDRIPQREWARLYGEIADGLNLVK